MKNFARDITWEEISEEKYFDRLGALPPRMQRLNGFLLGEPSDYCPKTGLDRYLAFKEDRGAFFASSRPVTVAEFDIILR
jgi:hypothetical protein